MTLTKMPALALAFALVAGSSGPSLALTPQEEAVFRQSCTADYMRFCSTFDPGSLQVDQCFKQRMKELSPQCQAAITAYTKNNPGGGRR